MPENEEPSITERARKIALAAMADSVSPQSPSIDDILEAHPDIATEVKRQLTLLGLVRAATEKEKSASEEDPDPLSHDTTRVVHVPDTGGGFHNQPTLVRCPTCRQQLPLIEFSEEEYSRRISCDHCENSVLLLNNSRRLHSGAMIAHFELVSPLGAGSFGLVWKAWDTKLQRDVALKVPRRGLLTSDQQDLFLREARVAAAIRHPHVVAIHDAGVDRGTVYICSDLIDGTTLAQWHRESCDSPSAGSAMIQKIAAALQAIHDCSVIHRDLKPSNVMVDSKGNPQVMDFGLAKQDVFEATMTLSGEVLGTPAYMSPEAAKGESRSSDPRTDIYSLGVMLYELLTGELPYRGDFTQLVQQILHAQPRSPVEINPRIPTDLQTICLKCMEKDPRDRYQTAKELAEDLSRFADGNMIFARPQSLTQRAIRITQSHPWMTVTSISFAICLILLPIALRLAVKHQTDATLAREEVEEAKEEVSNAKAEMEIAEQQSQTYQIYTDQIEKSANEVFDHPIKSMQTALDAVEKIELDSTLPPTRRSKLLVQLQQTLQNSLITLGGEPLTIRGTIIETGKSPGNGKFAVLSKISRTRLSKGSRTTGGFMFTAFDATQTTADSKPRARVAYHPLTTVNQIKIDPSGEHALVFNSDVEDPEAAASTLLTRAFGKVCQGEIPHAIASTCFPAWSTDLWIVDPSGMATCWSTGVKGKLSPICKLATPQPVKRIHALASAGQLVTESEEGIQLWNVDVDRNLTSSQPLAGPSCKFVPFLPRNRQTVGATAKTAAGWWNRQRKELVLETWHPDSFDKRKRWTTSLPGVDDIGACYHSEEQQWLCANLIVEGVGAWHWWSLRQPGTQANGIPLPGDPQMGIEISPEEKDLVVGSRKLLSCFRVTQGTPSLQQTFPAGKTNIGTFAWLGNSGRIAVAYGNKIHLHQLHGPDGREPAAARDAVLDRQILRGHASPITRIFSGTLGQAFVTLDTDGQMRKWLVSQPRHDTLFELVSTARESHHRTAKVQIHETGKIAIALDSNGVLTVWNTQRMRSFFSTWYVVKREPRIAHATLQGSTLTIANEDGKVQVFSVSKHGFLSEKYNTESPLELLRISKNERWLALLGNGSSSMVDLSQPNNRPWDLPESGNPIAASFLGQSGSLLTIDADRKIKIWDSKNRTFTTPHPKLGIECTGTLVPGKKFVICPFDFGNITLFETSPQGESTSHSHQIHSTSEQMHLVQSKDGEHWAANITTRKPTRGGTLRTRFGSWSHEGNENLEFTIEQPTTDNTTGGFKNLLAISPDNRRLIRTGVAGFHAWYLPESRLIYFPNPNRSNDTATQLLFSPDGQWLIVGHNSGMIRLWPILDDKLHPTPIEFDLHKSPITSIAVDPLSRWCLFSSNDRICRMPLDIEILQDRANKRLRIESVLPANTTPGTVSKQSAPASL